MQVAAIPWLRWATDWFLEVSPYFWRNRLHGNAFGSHRPPFHGLMHDLERAVVGSAGASAGCEIASEEIESYVKLVIAPHYFMSRFVLTTQ